jgi:hypothetical protein
MVADILNHSLAELSDKVRCNLHIYASGRYSLGDRRSQLQKELRIVHEWKYVRTYQQCQDIAQIRSCHNPVLAHEHHITVV